MCVDRDDARLGGRFLEVGGRSAAGVSPGADGGDDPPRNGALGQEDPEGLVGLPVPNRQCFQTCLFGLSDRMTLDTDDPS